jgi:hypothetical protein
MSLAIRQEHDPPDTIPIATIGFSINETAWTEVTTGVRGARARRPSLTRGGFGAALAVQL